MVAVAIGGAALIGGVATVASGNKAASATKSAANQVVSAQERQAAQDRADLAPWRETGSAALATLGSVYGIGPNGQPATSGAAPDYSAFYKSPDYAFRLSEGQKAIDRAGSARGLLGSGANQKAQVTFAENTAAGGFNDWWNKLAGVAGVGQAATNTGIQSGQNATNNISSAYTAAGNARASSYLNTGSAINSTVNNLASVYAFNAGGGFAKSPFAR